MKRSHTKFSILLTSALASMMIVAPAAAQKHYGKAGRPDVQVRDDGERDARDRDRSGREGRWGRDRTDPAVQPGRVEPRRDDTRVGNDGWRGRTPSVAVPAPTDDGRRGRHDDSRRDGSWRDGTDRDGDGRRDGSWRNRTDDRDGRWNGRDGRDGRSGYGYGYGDNGYRDTRSDTPRAWDRRWRDSPRYDWNRYRYANRSLFSPGRYYSPYRSDRYFRIMIGSPMRSGYFHDRYWINDPWRYRLPAAYGPYRWVRYYDDVLLVDLRNGRVVDVLYDFFW